MPLLSSPDENNVDGTDVADHIMIDSHKKDDVRVMNDGNRPTSDKLEKDNDLE